MSNKPQVIIIDDKIKEDKPLIIKLKQKYDEIKIFNISDEGLNYLKENLHKKMIVLLDLCFPSGESTGHDLLNEIKKMSKLVPIIIWSAADVQSEEYIDFINANAFAFLQQVTTIQHIIDKIVEAESWLDLQVASVLEDWINLHSDVERKNPYFFKKDGKSYSLDQALIEIRNRSDVGLFFEKGIIKLAIELLAKNIKKFKV